MAKIEHVFHVETDDLEFTFGVATTETPTKSEKNRSPRDCTPRSIKSDGSFEFTFGPGGISFAKTDTPSAEKEKPLLQIAPPVVVVDPTSPHSQVSLEDDDYDAGDYQHQIPGLCARIPEQPQHYVAPAPIPAAPAQIMQYTHEMLIAQQEQEQYIQELEYQQQYATVIEQQQLAAQAQAAAAAQVVHAEQKYAIAQAEWQAHVQHEQTVKATSSCCTIL